MRHLTFFQHPDRFVTAMVGYTGMSDEDIWLNTFIQRDQQGQYIILLDGENDHHTERLYLEDIPITSAPDLLSTGIYAYRAKASGSGRMGLHRQIHLEGL